MFSSGGIIVEQELYDALNGSIQNNEQFMDNFVRAVELIYEGNKLTR